MAPPYTPACPHAGRALVTDLHSSNLYSRSQGQQQEQERPAGARAGMVLAVHATWRRACRLPPLLLPASKRSLLSRVPTLPGPPSPRPRLKKRLRHARTLSVRSRNRCPSKAGACRAGKARTVPARQHPRRCWHGRRGVQSAQRGKGRITRANTAAAAAEEQCSQGDADPPAQISTQEPSACR